MKSYICITKFENHKIGDILFTGESWTSWKKSFCIEIEVSPLIDINYLKVIWKETKEEHWIKGDEKVFTKPMFPEYWAKEGETNVYTQPMLPEHWVSEDGQTIAYEDPSDETYTYVPEDVDTSWNHNPAIEDTSYTYVPYSFEHWEVYEDVTSKLSEEMTAEISVKYIEMTADILTEMKTVFGTNKTDSAIAYQETWKEMIANPVIYIPAGATARFVIASFNVGDALDTEGKITTYATAKLEEAKAYGVFRIQRIEQFRNEKDTIIANYGV